jgi:hypothetical protein
MLVAAVVFGCSSPEGSGDPQGGSGSGGQAGGAGGGSGGGPTGASGGGSGGQAPTAGSGVVAGGGAGNGAGSGGRSDGGAAGSAAMSGGAGASNGGGGVSSGGGGGQSNGGSNAECQMVKAEYMAELEKQLACNPNAGSQCTNRASSAPGCECWVFIQPSDPFAIEHLANLADGWFTADCSMPSCPAKCTTASAGKCQADSKSPLGGRCMTP